MLVEKTKLQMEKLNVVQRNEELNREKGALETERNELRDQLREVRDQNARLSDENVRLSAKNEMLSAEVDRMRTIEQDYNRMFNENANVRAAYERLVNSTHQGRSRSDFRVSVYDI